MMVTSVPYQLRSSAYARERAQRVRPTPGETRRGHVTDDKEGGHDDR
ncbi:MAG TPA: hypothetical protein VK059_14300 [Nocardioidaceae bacterium]|nr:hypothetical protein [Nocardioidaceae bacterium]